MNWDTFKVLKKSGPRFHWGDPDKMNPEFLQLLDRFFFDFVLEPYISFGTQGVHSPTSQHPHGIAADVLFPKQTLRDMPDIFFNALRYDFKGIGIYSSWKLSQGGAPVGGLHLDSRATQHKALWMESNKKYEPVNFFRMKELFR